MSNFEPDNFLHQEVEGETSTRGLPVPEGEHQAVIVEDGIKVDSGTSKDGNPYYYMDVNWEILNRPDIEEELGRKPRTRMRIFLDIDDGKLDNSKGKNTGLGRLREAVGMNGPEPFKPTDLIGQTATIMVSHREYEGNIFDEVRKVAAPES